MTTKSPVNGSKGPGAGLGAGKGGVRATPANARGGASQKSAPTGRQVGAGAKSMKGSTAAPTSTVNVRQLVMDVKKVGSVGTSASAPGPTQQPPLSEPMEINTEKKVVVSIANVKLREKPFELGKSKVRHFVPTPQRIG